MNRRGIALIGVLTLLFLNGCSDKNSNSTKIGHIEGRVTIDGAGVPGVLVSVSAYRLTDGGNARIGDSDAIQGTSEEGDYIVDLLPGQYRVDYSVSYFGTGFSTARYPIDVGSDAHVRIDVELKDPTPVNLIAIDDNVSVRLSFYRGYNIENYNIYRATGISGDFQLIATVNSSFSPVSYYDRPAQIGSYRYKVAGVYQNGDETAFSNESDIDFTAMVAPPLSFTAEDNLTYVELNWHIANYIIYTKIYRATGTGPFTVIDSTSSHTYVDIPESFNTYKYRITAVSTYHTESIPTTEQVINYDGRLEPPTNFSVADHGNVLYLSWNQSGHDSQYNIYRSLVVDDDFVKIDSTDELSYSDRPPLGHTYYYRVSAVAFNGMESGLSVADAALFDGLLEPPTSLYFEDYGLSLMLTWSPVPYAGAYIVYRSDDNGNVYNQITRAGSNYNYFYDTPLTSGEKYYKIASETADGTVGPLSSPYIVYFSNNLLPPTNIQVLNRGLRVNVSWQASYGTSKYAIYRASHAEGDYAIIVDNFNSTFFVDDPPIAGAYYYRIVAKDDIGHVSPMSDYGYVYFTDYPEPPSSVTGIDYDVYVVLNWTSAAGVSRYMVFKSATPYGDYMAVDTVNTTSFIDWPSESGHIYYKVKSLDGGRLSEFSEFAHVFFSGNLDSPRNLTGGDNGSRVVLNWDAVPHAEEYDVYRGDDSEHMTLNQTVYTTTASDTPDIAGNYYYGIIARTQGGLESPMTTPILVHFTP